MFEAGKNSRQQGSVISVFSLPDRSSSGTVGITPSHSKGRDEAGEWGRRVSVCCKLCELCMRLRYSAVALYLLPSGPEVFRGICALAAKA